MYLDNSTFVRYRDELKLFKPEEFHIGPTEISDEEFVRICCGGSTDARIQGFKELFNLPEHQSYVVGDGFAASNSLIGYMEAQKIILFFENRSDYQEWLSDSAELDFLKYNDNSKKSFALSCPNYIDLNELSEILDTEVTTDLSYDGLKGTKMLPNPYVDSMVMVPTGSFPYRTEPIILPRDARGMYFSGYITEPNNVDVTGAVFYNCQRHVDGALNFQNLTTLEQRKFSLKEVTIDRPFLVSQSPITRALYDYVTNIGQVRDYDDIESWELVFEDDPPKAYDSLPEGGLSWFDVLNFCNALSVIQGFEPCYNMPEYLNVMGSYRQVQASELRKIDLNNSANGYRLLTEPQWEYVARANRGFKYSGSNDPRAVAAQYNQSPGFYVTKTGSLGINSFGTYDQSGNVHEWCYPFRKVEPYPPLKGGSLWEDGDTDGIRIISNYSTLFSDKYGDLGGRLCRFPSF